MNSLELASYIDHTLLKPDATREQIETLCHEAIEYGFASVCVNPCYVSLASSILKDTKVKVCTVIGFPLGATTKETKVFETKKAISEGADEIDMVINIGALKGGDVETVREDIKAVVEASAGEIVKVIIETCLLTDEEKRIACKLSKEQGAAFVKTSTGFSHGGATAEDIKLMRDAVGALMGIKASGGVKTVKTVLLMIEAGATRIGTSSGVAIVRNLTETDKNCY